MQQDPFGIYIHWPFCAAKCPYCDFNSHVRQGGVDQQAYAEGLVAELAWHASQTRDRVVESVFFGGGTPSLMDPRCVDMVLNAIAKYWTVAETVEITMEANPTSVESQNFKGYVEAGVNRVSVGVQALNDPDLQFLGRQHSVSEALQAIGLARETFPRMSFDLIYARPEQTMGAWRKELKQAIDFAADHLSLYQLTIEPDTTFAKLYEAGKLNMPTADQSAALYETTQELCAAEGIPAYEISNHARPGAECLHNLLYWRYGCYIGVGPGAHSRVGAIGERHALSTERKPEAWLDLVRQNGHGLILDDVLTAEEQGDEFLLMGLRLKEGIDPIRFTQISGRTLDPYRIEDLIQQNMVEMLETGYLRVRPEGWFVLDAVVADLAA